MTKEYRTMQKLKKYIVSSKEYTEDLHKYFVGSAIMDKKGQILTMQMNSYSKTHPLMVKYAKGTKRPERSFLHAELTSLIKCRFMEQAYEMVIVRINRHKEFCLAKPCEICSLGIKNSNIKKVYYSNHIGELILYNI